MKPANLSVALAALLLAGCATTKPVIYPNAHAQSVGQAQVEADVYECRSLAESAGATPHGGSTEHTAKATVRGGAVGAATGAVGGAIGGAVVQGAKIGAATGATASLLHTLLSEPTPNPAYRNFVERCLRDRGYDVTGWN